MKRGAARGGCNFGQCATSVAGVGIFMALRTAGMTRAAPPGLDASKNGEVYKPRESMV
ncbi:MAG TPA: hypothetical protein VN924_29075 [Bryobacteraceae bacterium]|nr:hypothetical protein [Bryobacteraceae bacterium]